MSIIERVPSSHLFCSALEAFWSTPEYFGGRLAEGFRGRNISPELVFNANYAVPAHNPCQGAFSIFMIFVFKTMGVLGAEITKWGKTSWLESHPPTWFRWLM